MPKARPQQLDQDDLLDLSRFIPYQVVVLSGYFGQELAKVYAEHGLAISEWRVMASVAEHPGITANDLASIVRLDEVAVHRAVKSLMDRELLRRTQDDEDRRRKPLELSPKGRVIYRKIVPKALDFEQRVLSTLSVRERETLVKSLTILYTRLGLARGREGQQG